MTQEHAETLKGPGFVTNYLTPVGRPRTKLSTVSFAAATAGKYENVVDLAEKTIVAEDNQKIGDKALGELRGVLVAVQKGAARRPQRPGAVQGGEEGVACTHRAIEIINEITLDTMRWCQGEEMDEKGWFVVRPSEPRELDDLRALLGTRTGQQPRIC